MSLFEPLVGAARDAPGRLVRTADVTPLLEQPAPAWYLDRDGVVLGANLLACQVWGADRPGDLLGHSIFEVMARALPNRLPPAGNEAMLAGYLALLTAYRAGRPDPADALLDGYRAFEAASAEYLVPARRQEAIAALWSHPVRLRVQTHRAGRIARLAARLRMLEGGWGAIVSCAPDATDRVTAELVRVWHKRAVRLWGTRSYVQYDASRFGDSAFVLKDVGLTRHRIRRDEATPFALAAVVQAALDAPGSRWKTAPQVAHTTGLPLDLVVATLHSLVEHGGDVARIRLPMRVGAGRIALGDRFVNAAPWWRKLGHRIECLRHTRRPG
jgi:hypothetical protein